MILLENVFFMQLLIGVIFTITGFVTLNFPPKQINDFYGYRTANSMKSQDKWNFSQRYSTIKMIQLGFGLICFSFFGMFFEKTELIQISVGISSALLICLILFITTERQLKIQFQDN